MGSHDFHVDDCYLLLLNDSPMLFDVILKRPTEREPLEELGSFLA